MESAVFLLCIVMDKAEDKAANRNDLLKIISGRVDKELNSSYIAV